MGKNLCRFCFSAVEYFSTAPVLRYQGEYFKCPNCLSVQVTNAFWIEEAHTNAISKLDTGLASRCISAANMIGTVLALEGLCFSRGVDWAGGTGLLTRLLRDQGFKVFTFDKYAEPLHANGFELTAIEARSEANFISAIECIEHLENPIEELGRYTSTKELFFFTVDLISEETPDPSRNEWWYFLPESGQHITFPTAKGLSFFGNTLGFNHYFRIGSMHVLSRRKMKLRTRALMRFKLIRRLLFIFLPIALSKRYSLTSLDQRNLINEIQSET
jgi:hypothetical protein